MSFHTPVPPPNVSIGKVSTGTRDKRTGELKFTFRDVKGIVKKNKIETKKKATVKRLREKRHSDSVKVFADEAARFLIKLGASEEERSRFTSLCEICNIGRQEFKKNSLRTLFGEESAHDHDRNLRDGFDDEEDYFANGQTLRARDHNRVSLFLRKRDDVGSSYTTYASGKRTANKSLGSDGVYIITLSVGTFANGAETSKTRRPDTVFIGLPPVAGSQHGTSSVDQDNLADLMIMKTYFVVRYIFTRLREEMNTATESLHCYRYPVIVIQQHIRTPQESPFNNDKHLRWYATMKSKMARGDSPFTRSLSQNYYINVV